jgi:hypothetical protein
MYMLQEKIFQKKKVYAIGEIDIFTCFGAVLYEGSMEGLNGKCQSFVRDLHFWAALQTPQQLSPIIHATDHLLRAFWTAGFTDRPPDHPRIY